MKKILLIFFVFSSIISKSQEHYCGYDLLMKQIEKNNPYHFQAINYSYQHALNNLNTRRLQSLDTVYIIPVVFHVLYNVASENIHDSLILNQLSFLNECFRRRNKDTGNLREIFRPFAGDPRIEFVLANKDPNGNPTNGIIRKLTSTIRFGRDDFQFTDNMKKSSSGGDDAWNTSKYLNIWICDNSSPTWGDAVLGYAYPPYGAENWGLNSYAPNPNLEGVVLHYKIIGKNNPLAINNLASMNRGITGVHEVGHYLGLRHIFADNNNSCLNDDGLFDTPKMRNKSNFDCNKSKNTCLDAGYDYPDMVENFMDYSSDACENTFTNQQIRVMRYCLTTLRGSALYTTRLDTFNIEDPIEPINSGDKFVIYPNPSNSDFTIFSVNNTKSFNLKIYDVLGNLILDKIYPAKSNTTIDTDVLNTGLYHLNIKYTDDSNYQNYKWIKTR